MKDFSNFPNDIDRLADGSQAERVLLAGQRFRRSRVARIVQVCGDEVENIFADSAGFDEALDMCPENIFA